MSTPTPGPWIAEGYDLRQKHGRMIAYFGPHHTPADEYPMSCRLQDEANCQWVAAARNELAEAKAEAAHYMSVAQKATDDLIQLLADKIRLDGLDAILAENAYRARLGWRWNPAGPDSDFKIHMSQDGKMISIRQALDVMLAARKEARK